MKSVFIVTVLCLAVVAAENTFPGPRPTDSAVAVQQQDPVALLLSENQSGKDSERLAYVRRCEKAADRYPESALRAALYKQIGDVYFDLNQLRYAGKWNRWYRKAAAVRPSLAKETPIGYRLQEYSRIALRRDLLTAVFAVYAFVLLAFILRFLRSRRTFDTRFFLKRCVLFLGVYAALAAAVFIVDIRIFSTLVRQKPLFAGEAIINPATAFPKPLIPLSVCDPSNASRAAVILLLGFLPIALALLYVSFGKPFSRAFLSAMVFTFCVSLWLHFLIATGSDAFLATKIVVTKSRIVYRGELGKLLRRNPAKALRACPDLLKSGNDDLEKFIKKHYPEGLSIKK